MSRALAPSAPQRVVPCTPAEQDGVSAAVVPAGGAAGTAGDAETAKASYSLAVKMIQKTASKNIIHKNKSNRLVSRLTLKYNAFTRGEDFRQAKHFEISPRIVDTSVFAEQLKQYELCQASEACVADLREEGGA